MGEELQVVIFDVDEFKRKTINLDRAGREIERVKDRMFRRLKNIFLDADFIFYNTQNSDSLILVFENTRIYRKKKEKTFKKAMEEVSIRYGFTYTVGIGRAVFSVFDVPHSFKEALEAVRIGRTMLGLGGLHEYKDIEIFSLLDKTINKDVLGGELLREIRSMTAYDKENKTNYYEFLVKLIKAGWNLTKVSKNNYIHYNTAKYRLKKIEEIADINIDDENTRFKLELAIRLFELRKTL